MLVIHPDECIDCGVCEPKCPGRRHPSGHRRRGHWRNGWSSTASTPRIGRSSSPRRTRFRTAEEMDGKQGKIGPVLGSSGRGRLTADAEEAGYGRAGGALDRAGGARANDHANSLDLEMAPSCAMYTTLR